MLIILPQKKYQKPSEKISLINRFLAIEKECQNSILTLFLFDTIFPI